MKIQETRAKLETVIKHIQQIQGYEYFFDFLSLDKIKSTLINSFEALVYITTTIEGTIILIITIEEIQSLCLPFNTDSLGDLLHGKTAKSKKNNYLISQLLGIEVFEKILENSLPMLGKYLIEPLAGRLHNLNIKKITLVPIGTLSLLPLHAACYLKHQEVKYFCEEFIISYIPNALALVTAQRELQKRNKLDGKLFGIANTRPTSNPLAATTVELQAISSLFTPENHHVLEEKQATYEALIKNLTTSNYLHFACHGVYDLNNSLASHLQLRGQETFSLSELLFGDVRPSQARLAVLSACRTGVIAFRQVPDESIGFPAGFLQAGVPGVISTLWAVDDISTSILMIRFYQYHLQKKLNPSEALQQAQCWLRNATGKQLHFFCRQFFQEAAKKEPYLYKTIRHLACFICQLTLSG